MELNESIDEMANETSSEMSCSTLLDVYESYAEVPLNLLGLILNLLNVYAFSQRCMHKNINGHAINYLLLKSCTDSFVQASESLLKQRFFMHHVYWPKLAERLLYHYVGSIAHLCSVLCQLMANFDRYAHLTANNFRRYKRKKNLYRPIMLTMLLVGMTVHSYELVSSHLAADWLKWLRFVSNSVLRDLILSILIFILNMLIIKMMAEALLTKRRLQGLCNSNRARNSLILNDTSFSTDFHAPRQPRLNSLHRLSTQHERRAHKLIQKLSLTTSKPVHSSNSSSSSSASLSTTSDSPWSHMQQTRRISRISIKFEHTLIQKYNKAESNLSVTLILNGFLVIVGHVASCLNYLPLNLLLTHQNICYTLVRLSLLHLSLTLHFFVYVSLNHKFRSILNLKKKTSTTTTSRQQW